MRFYFPSILYLLPVCYFLFSLSVSPCFSSPLGPEIATDSDLPASKFTSVTPLKPSDVSVGTDATQSSFPTPSSSSPSSHPASKCPIHLELNWIQHLDTSISSSSLIASLSPSESSFVVPGISRFLSILTGEGHHRDGSPLEIEQEKGNFYSSPLSGFDSNGDGVKDLLWVSLNGEILLFNGNLAGPRDHHRTTLKHGEFMRTSIPLPKLRVKQHWYAGLNEKGLNHEQQAGGRRSRSLLQDGEEPQWELDGQQEDGEPNSRFEEDDDFDPSSGADEMDGYDPEYDDEFFDEDPLYEQELREAEELLRGDDDQEQDDDNQNQNENENDAGNDSPDGAASESDSVPDQLGDGLTPEARESLDLFSSQNDDQLIDDYSERFDRLQADDSPNQPAKSSSEPLDRSATVDVDAHVLATPTLVDVNRDGKLDLLIPVSYYFDEQHYYSNPHLFTHLPDDINIRKYVVGSLLALDLYTGKVIWREELDRSTDETELKAYIYSTPTVVDFEGDGELEVVIGTGLGLIYCLNAHTGALKPGFPVVMSEIQGQIAVEDVNGDGELEIIAADSKGNVACFNSRGEEIWSYLISGFASQTPSIGDINGDGILEIVIGTVNGFIWALNGMTGKPIPGFPVKTSGRIVSPISLIRFQENSLFSAALNAQTPGLHLVVPSYDGHLYVIQGSSGCFNRFDIGERSYGQVLAHDFHGTGHLDLFFTTINGNLFSLATSAPSRRLNRILGPQNDPEGIHHSKFTPGLDYWGVQFTSNMVQFLADCNSPTATIEFEIVDRRAKTQRIIYGKSDAADKSRLPIAGRVEYRVELRFQGRSLWKHQYDRPGVYSVQLNLDIPPQSGRLELICWNEFSQRWTDEVEFHWNQRFYKPIKYFLLAPFVFLVAVVAGWQFLQPAELPMAGMGRAGAMTTNSKGSRMD